MNIVLSTLNAKYIHTSLALRYLKTYCQPNFSNINILEFTIKDLTNHIVAKLYEQQPDVIGFSVYIWNIEETILVVNTLKKVLPHTKIIFGGPEVSYDVREWMSRIAEVDYIVVGEGEETFYELLKALTHNEPVSTILGLAYREAGKFIVNTSRPKLPLQNVSNPYLDVQEYPELRHRIVYFESSRGCPFSCQFCLSSIESGVRYFPIDEVKNRLRLLMDAGIRTIKFVDRTFNLDKKYAVALFQFLIDYPSDTVFQFEITGDILSDEIVEFLSNHAPQGRFRFEIGVQSTNDVTNVLVKRRQNFDKLSRTVTAIRESGRIVQHLDLIAGLPEEDYATFRKTFDDVFLLRPDELQLGFLKMLRGTGLRMAASQYGYVYMDRAPYEILGNQLLNYTDILRIKQVEDVLEKYWNDNRMRRTVDYLIETHFHSAFDFFQSFGAYWDEQGWSRIGHQLDDLFRRLHSFLIHFGEHTCEVIPEGILQSTETLMKIEYLQAHKIRPSKLWWRHTVNKQLRNQLYRQIESNPSVFGQTFADLNLPVNILERHTVIDIVKGVPTQLATPTNHVNKVTEEQLLLVYYPSGIGRGEDNSVFLAPYQSEEVIHWPHHSTSNTGQ